MNESDWQLWGNIATVVATFAAICGLAWQIRQSMNDRIEAASAEIKNRKIAVISDIVAYRFVLTANGNAIPEASEARFHFNTALSRVAIEFLDNCQILTKYDEIGDEFTSQKFQELVSLMTEDATGKPLSTLAFKALEKVPTRTL
jgi:hypothetical protein